eukprot:s3797_g8.t1
MKAAGHTVVVKSTFVDVKEGRNLKEICHDLRKCKSESSLFDILEEAYMPGKFSDEQEELRNLRPFPTSQAEDMFLRCVTCIAFSCMIFSTSMHVGATGFSWKTVHALGRPRSAMPRSR